MKITICSIKNLLQYVMVLLLIISCNSMVFRSDMIAKSGGFSEYYLFILIFFVTVLYRLICKKRINKSQISQILVMIVFLLLVFIVQLIFYSFNIAKEFFLRFVLVFISLFMFLGIEREEEYLEIFEKLVKIVTLLGLISIVLWILGSLLDLLPFSFVNTDWSSGRDGLFLPVKSYYNLMFESQGEVSIFGIKLIRNCGIFPEAPMYGFVLVIALILNEFILNRENNLYTVILSMTIFTTTSYTAIACCMIVVLMKLFLVQKDVKNNIIRLLLFLIIVVATILGVLIIKSLVIEKSTTNITSTTRRLSDIQICFNTFKDTIIGSGFYNQPLYTDNLSGSTSGFFRLLAEMGILIGWMPIYFAYKILKSSDEKWKSLFFLAIFFIMYIFTNLPYTPLVLILFVYAFTKKIN